jgi:hypothetical protein
MPLPFHGSKSEAGTDRLRSPAWGERTATESHSMSGKEPIELPALFAERRGPSAAVCASGHVLSWLVEAGAAAKYCAKCGDPILVACPTCNATLPADGEMLQWVPYHANCQSCGQAYPWKASEIARVRRTLAEQAESEHWSDAVRARAEELVDDVAADRAAASGVVTALKWLALRGGEGATATILETIERLASPTLKQALRPSFPGLF